MTRFRHHLSHRSAARGGLLSVLAVLLTLALATPMAAAHHKEDHEQGQQADTDGTETTTSSASSGDSGSSSDGGPPKGCDQAGFNDGGAYDSTCDGTPGEQGNDGNDKVAGSEGSADNKFPPGQIPSGPDDGNNGYECDGNNGISKGNPAHTRCKQPPPPTAVCVPTAANNFCQPPNPPKPPKTPEEPEVLKKFVRRPPPTAPPAVPPAVEGRRASQLPVTGFESTHALWIALYLMVMGACLTLVVEERST